MTEIHMILTGPEEAYNNEAESRPGSALFAGPRQHATLLA